MDPNIPTYIAFFALSGLTLLGGLAVVTLRNLLHCALSLVAAFIGVAGLYLLLQAEFIAVVQILLYVGAVTVLILFAIMLTERLMDRRLRQFTGKWWIAAAFSFVLFAALIAPAVWQTWQGSWMQRPSEGLPEEPVAALGEQLMTTYVLPFEVASILLLVALVGAIAVAWPARDRLVVVEELEHKVARAKVGWGSAEQTGTADTEAGSEVPEE